MSILRFLLASSVLCVVGCADGDSNGGACGSVAEGGACTAATDCACDLDCLSGSCTVTYGPALVEGGVIRATPYNPPSLTPAATALCERASELGCEGYQPVEHCESVFTWVENRADEHECGAAYRTVANCVAQGSSTCEDFRPFDERIEPDMTLICQSEREAYRECIKATCYPNADYCAPESDGSCELSYRDGCGGVAQGHCVPAEGAEGERVTCTCADGTPKAGNTFDVFVTECCQANSVYLGTACGYAPEEVQ